MSLRLLATGACAALLLTACLVPERFTARIAFAADGSYAYSYAGTGVHTLTAGQMGKGSGGEAGSPKRYDLSVEGKRQRAQALDLAGVLRVRTGPDGVLNLQAGKLDDKEKASMAKLGIKLDGTLSVTVPISAEVIAHNATTTPSFFGLIGTYAWKIDSLEQRPQIVIRFKQ